MKADIEYIDDGMFITFVPNTPEGEQVWRQLAESTDGTGKVFAIHAKQVVQDMRKAGYTVRKAKPASKKDINKMLKEFDELFTE